MAACVPSPRVERRRPCRPPRITAMRSLIPRISGISDEIITIATPALRQRPHQRVDLRLRPDVDALRRLVEDQDRRLVSQPARQRDLLLVAARERADVGVDRRGLDAQLARRSRAPRGARRRVNQAVRGTRRADWPARVGRHRHLQHHAVLAAILRHVGDARRDRGLRRRDATGRAVEQDLARVGRAQPEHRLRPARCGPIRRRPARPRISPRRTVSDTSRMPDARCVTPRISSATSPMRRVRFGKTAESSRPTISRIRSARVDVARARASPTVWPSRSTVIRSATVTISSSRCEM